MSYHLQNELLRAQTIYADMCGYFELIKSSAKAHWSHQTVHGVSYVSAEGNAIHAMALGYDLIIRWRLVKQTEGDWMGELHTSACSRSSTGQQIECALTTNYLDPLGCYRQNLPSSPPTASVAADNGDNVMHALGIQIARTLISCDAIKPVTETSPGSESS